MNLEEKKLSEKVIYEGKILRLHVDQVELPDGTGALREVADHPGGVGILAIDSRNRAAIVRQYRYPFRTVMAEIPAGKREPGEAPEITAVRELKEETGAEAGKWAPLGSLIPSPGAYGERLWLYLATELSFGEVDPDEDEFLECEWVPVERLAEMCMNGEIEDAKTVVAVLKAHKMMGK